MNEKTPICINLNDYVRVRLSTRGQDIWRLHIGIRRALFAQLHMAYTGPTGDEAEITVQFWEFLAVFGGDQNWTMGAAAVPVSDMNIEVTPS